MKLSSKTSIILGPPGTGKTTALLSIVDDLLSSGVQPEKICFLSFTRKAVEEAKERAVDKFKLSPNKFPYFKTIHALCFQELGLTRQAVMSFGDYCEIAKAIGISITNRVASEDGMVSGMSKGDRLLFTENLARVNRISVEEQYNRLGYEDFFLEELVQVEKTLAKFKQLTGKLDFTDMIDQFALLQKPINIDYLIVDEAQDLARNQWEIVELLSRRVIETFVAGDDDQAIFRWAGADVDTFIELEGDVWVLDQSYRIPKNVRTVADSIIAQVSKRRDKDWYCRGGDDGIVAYCNCVEELDLSKGTWLLLARNTHLLQKYNEFCIEQGFLYDSTAGSVARSDSLKAIRFWEMLRKGTKVTVEQAALVYEYMSTRERIQHGGKSKLEKEDKSQLVHIYDLRTKFGLMMDAPWHVALNKIPQIDKSYFMAAFKRGEKISSGPRIKISTIHSIKGGQADNVVICPDMASRTWEEYAVNQDDEARVWYVGVTRAKKALYILTPETSRAFPV